MPCWCIGMSIMTHKPPPFLCWHPLVTSCQSHWVPFQRRPNKRWKNFFGQVGKRLFTHVWSQFSCNHRILNSIKCLYLLNSKWASNSFQVLNFGMLRIWALPPCISNESLPDSGFLKMKQKHHSMKIYITFKRLIFKKNSNYSILIKSNPYLFLGQCLFCCFLNINLLVSLYSKAFYSFFIGELCYIWDMLLKRRRE